MRQSKRVVDDQSAVQVMEWLPTRTGQVCIDEVMNQHGSEEAAIAAIREFAASKSPYN